jgi:hypothetical protein
LPRRGILVRIVRRHSRTLAQASMPSSVSGSAASDRSTGSRTRSTPFDS